MTDADRVADIRLLLFDVDGVLTDGVVLMHADGSEAKGFHIRDGAAMVWAQRAGLTVGLLSATIVGSDHPSRGAAGDQARGARAPTASWPRTSGSSGIPVSAINAVAYMGDDLLDLPVLTRVGLSAAPADAAAEVISRVHWVSSCAGGRGAVREFIEMVLRAQNRWDNVLREYLPVD